MNTHAKGPNGSPLAKAPAADAPILVLDTGSPTSSVAIGRSGECLGERSFELRRTAEELLPSLRALLGEVGLGFADLGGVVALQGPGSFTGLRIGLSTALGFHQAQSLPATALGTLPVLALWGLGEKAHEVTVAVDALRGEFYSQLFWRGEGKNELLPQGEAKLYTAAQLALSPGKLVGVGLEELFAKAGIEVPEAKLSPEPPPLAALAIPLLSGLDWDPGRLIQPIYFRPPAVTVKAVAVEKS